MDDVRDMGITTLDGVIKHTTQRVVRHDSKMKKGVCNAIVGIGICLAGMYVSNNAPINRPVYASKIIDASCAFAVLSGLYGLSQSKKKHAAEMTLNDLQSRLEYQLKKEHASPRSATMIYEF